jgi:hypothetical protein
MLTIVTISVVETFEVYKSVPGKSTGLHATHPPPWLGIRKVLFLIIADETFNCYGK